MTFRPLTRSLLLYVVLCALLLGASWHFYSATFQEQGDIALNALQIDRAKHFEEIYGNYSRFHFNHPGPAFFYIYAASERLLTDTLHWTPPHIAHSLAGAFLQAAFFVLALHLFAQLVSRPLFLPLALLAGAFHFSKIGAAFVSIWPPHVLLMPFLAFWVACLSVAMGRGQNIFWAVFCGSMLVHGHVAQPLFVGGLSAAAYATMWWNRRKAGEIVSPLSAFRWAHVLSLLVLALFLFPMALDLAKGDDSNFQAILRHLRYAGDHKKFIKSLLYFFSFLSYVSNQEVLLQQLSWDSARFFRDNFGWYLGWIGLISFVVAYAWRGFGLAAEKLRLVRIGSAFWAFSVALCLYWGRMQSGQMFQYNGYFYYSLLFVFVLLAIAIIAEKCAALPVKWFNVGALIAAGAIAWTGLRYPPFSKTEAGTDVRDQTLSALAADPRPQAPKILVFPHDNWPEAAGISLVLARNKVPFFVDPSWTFMFQKLHELNIGTATDGKTEFSIWRILPRKEGRGIPFAENLSIVFETPTLSPDDGNIDFGYGGNFELYQVVGFSTPTAGDYAPTAQQDAILQFKPLPTTKSVSLHIAAEPFLGAGHVKIQPTELRFNGHLVFSAPFTEPGVLRAAVPAEIWNERPIATVHLTMPNALSPAELGLSGDVRRLGLSVKKLTTRTAE